MNDSDDSTTVTVFLSGYAVDIVDRLRAERDEAQMEYADALIARDAAIRRAETAEADADRLDAAGWHYFECSAARRNAACTCGRDEAEAAHDKAVAERGQP